MEPLPQSRHGRKHSSARNAFSSPSFSLKDPYDDVSLSRGGKCKFGVHDYTEIFSGSSTSIPVLDLSSLEERVASGELRGSRLDYSNIFGGLGNDEVAVPYEELLRGAKKKTKAQNPAKAHSPRAESGSLHPPGKTKKPSGGATDQSIDGIKQQFNMSFNKTSQTDCDESNGKTHIAQLHAVPGFTCFVDGIPQLSKKEGELPVSSLKREVSRTWSFNVGVVNGSTCKNSPVPDKPGDWNEINLKSDNTEVSSPSSHPHNPVRESDPRCSRFPSFDSKDAFKSDNAELSHPYNPVGECDPRGSRFPSFDSRDASKRTAGKHSLTAFDMELDENSVAAVSAAALMKAVEHAQESIRLARMIMEKKKGNLQGEPKPWSKGHLKVKDKNETRTDTTPDGLNHAWETYERLDTSPIITGINGKFAATISHSGKYLNTGKDEEERVSVKVETAKRNGDASSEAGKRFAASCSQSGTLYSAETSAPENIETADECQGVINLFGLSANGECRTEALDPGKCGNHDNLVCPIDKVQSHIEEMETVTGNLEQLTIHQTNGDEALAELADRAPCASKNMQETGRSLDDSLVQSKATEDIAESSESVLNSSESMQHQEKTVHGLGENLCVMQEVKATEERDDVVDGKAKHDKIFLEHEEMVFGEHLTIHKYEFNNLLSGFRSLAEEDMLELEDMENVSETYPDWKGNDEHHWKGSGGENMVMYKEAHLLFESEQQLKDSLEEQIREREPQVVSEVGGDGKGANDVKEQNCEQYCDGQKSASKYEQYETVERQMDTSKFEEAETIQMEVHNCAEVLKDEVAWEAEETLNTHTGLGRSEDNVDKFDFRIAASESENSEAVDACDNNVGTSGDACSNDTSNISSEIQEPRNVDLNDQAAEYRVAINSWKGNSSLTRVTDAFSSDEGKEPEKLFHQEVNEITGTDSLRRCASEENFIGSKLSSAFEGFASDSSTENAGLGDADPEEKLPRPEDMFQAASKINNVAQVEAAKIVLQDFPDFYPYSKAAEFDHTYMRLELEQTSEIIKRTVSASVLEGMIGVSAQESQERAENAEDNSLKELEVKNGLDMTSERGYVEEQRERLHPECQTGGLDSPPNDDLEEIEKSMETKREVETGKTMEKDKENLSGPFTIKQKEARATWQKVETIDRQQRIEAIKKGREREKDRKAAERAIREARERAFAEAREKAERAAVERAAAEARQRVLAEAQEKLEKASMESKQSADKLSTEAKIRAERAAVERATAEARERALEKAMSQKTYTEARTQAEKYSTEKFSGSSRDKGLKHSFSSSDLEKFDETTSESAQRRKARLERHQRITERAAKALAEKNKRDLLAQKEQAEKNRLAETLDAEIKRWAAGKEGNLRALLSTLQYILGPESGWQPTSLTEIITTAAVKKAYRKATLCVHPDKLQQRGASIQQKYICEKVFDLLKAAWNRFNSEEI